MLFRRRFVLFVATALLAAWSNPEALSAQATPVRIASPAGKTYAQVF